MGLALRKEEFVNAFDMPRLPDFSAAFGLIENLNEFKKLVTDFDVRMRVWRADLRQRLDAGIVLFREKSAKHDAEVVAQVLPEVIDEALAAVESARTVYETRFEDRDDFRLRAGRLARISGPPARFIRKQLDRIEDIRQKQLGAIDAVRTELVHLRQEIVDDAEFHRWSKVSLERYPVVNEYLGR
ncbi:MAG TPA: hypothetical protein VNS34_14285 [Rhizobiaceae bacterium]|nr:hypothetical protein [Rhizobiaceae bacterium]